MPYVDFYGGASSQSPAPHAILWHFNSDLLSTAGANGFSLGTLDNSVFKYGGGSMRVSGGGISSASYDFSQHFAGSWTIEAWFRTGAAGQLQLYIETDRIGIDYSAAGGVIVWHLENNAIVNEVVTSTISGDTFQHWAIVRDKVASTYSLYFHGARMSFVNSGTDLTAGSANDALFTASITDGYADDLRFSPVALYSGATYTVPSAQFPD